MATTECIHGIKVCSITKERFRELIENDLFHNSKRTIIPINPEKIMKAKKEKKLNEILNGADYQIADGIGVVLASRLQKGCIRERITGIGCLEMLCEIASSHSYSVFLYGAKPGVVKKAKENLEIKYTSLNITGYTDGYSDNDTVIKQIQTADPDIIFVALGSPKQEYWIHENNQKLKAKVFLGVGGSFEVISGVTRRAPLFIQNMGLEWLYRTIKQPKRIKRHIYLWAYLFNIIHDRITKPKHKDK